MASLKQPALEGTLLETAAKAALQVEWIMLRRWVFIIGVTGLGLLLDGCTKCGPIWDDWMQPSKSCRSDHL